MSRLCQVCVLGAIVIGLVGQACTDTPRTGEGLGRGSSPPRPSEPSPDSHEFIGTKHAPFISLAVYKPIYDRQDPGWMLVDVRGAVERAADHIPDDVWVPLADLETTGWSELRAARQDRFVVLYCGCPWAEAAYASAVLATKGLSFEHLRVLEEGLPGWIEAGYPVIQGADPCATDRRWPIACQQDGATAEP